MSDRKTKSKGPTYRHHKPTDTARCWVNGAWKSLGRYNSPESHAAFAKVRAEFRSGAVAQLLHGTQAPTDRTVDEVVLAFWRFAEQHYRRPTDRRRTS